MPRPPTHDGPRFRIPVFDPQDAREPRGDFDIGQWIAQLDTTERLVARTAEALLRKPLVRGRYIEVVVQNGVVTLEGELESDEAREAARRQVSAVPGVRDVCDRLRVAPPDAG